jgi:hypothetical protein
MIKKEKVYFNGSEVLRSNDMYQSQYVRFYLEVDIHMKKSTLLFGYLAVQGVVQRLF